MQQLKLGIRLCIRVKGQQTIFGAGDDASAEARSTFIAP